MTLGFSDKSSDISDISDIFGLSDIFWTFFGHDGSILITFGHLTGHFMGVQPLFRTEIS